MSRIRRKYLREGDPRDSGEVVGRGTSPDGSGLRFEPVRGRSADRSRSSGILRFARSSRGFSSRGSRFRRSSGPSRNFGSLTVYACVPVRFGFLLSSGFRASSRHAPQAPPRAARPHSPRAVHRRYWPRSGAEPRRGSSRFNSSKRVASASTAFALHPGCRSTKQLRIFFMITF